VFNQSKLGKAVSTAGHNVYIYRTSDSIEEIESEDYFGRSSHIGQDEHGWENGLIAIITSDDFLIYHISEDGHSIHRLNFPENEENDD